MSEFAAFSPDSAVDHVQRYNEFKEKHNKGESRKSDVEHIRKHVFKDNARYKLCFHIDYIDLLV